jgi:hypothetical protein
MLGKIQSAPLNARRTYDAVLPHHHTRSNLSYDPIYQLHPSVRLDLQSPLVLQPTSTNHNPALVENTYITGVHSTNPQSENNFSIYLYLPIDYNTTNEVLELVTTELKLLEVA